MVTDNSAGVKKISVFDRILLLITGLLAAYQIGFGINAADVLPTVSYTVGFGVLLVAGLLILILGFEILLNPAVVIVSTLIPLSLSTGLIAEYCSSWAAAYLIFAIIGFLLVTITRYKGPYLVSVLTLVFVHGISGMIIFLLPIIRSAQGMTPIAFSWVGVGGALIGVGGLMLSFLKMGKPILSRDRIFSILPGLLLAMVICFVVGFSV